MFARFRLRLVELVRLNGSPHGIAFGFTLGLGLSVIPVPFLGMVAALALAPIVRANLPATYFGSALVNPLTAPAIYFAEVWLGATLLDLDAPSWAAAQEFGASEWMALFGHLLPAFGLGGLALALGTALLAYPAVWLATTRVQARVDRID